MIVIRRALARLLASVLRRSLGSRHSRSHPPWLLCQADGEGLHFYAEADTVGVSYRTPGRPPAGAMAFNLSVLEIVGDRRGDEFVVLEPGGPQKARARWQDGNIPRVHEFDTRPINELPQSPELPKHWAPLPASFLRAFDESALTAAEESTKFAMSGVQLHGKAGQIVATDSKHALLQSGYRFPWDEVVLVPALRTFGLKELAQENAVRIGRTEKMVCLEVGPWIFFLGIQGGAKLPPVHEIIPRPKSITCRAQIHPEDAVFLARALPRLPGGKDELALVTLDLGRAVTVRARAAEGETVTEVELARSAVNGTAQQLALNRTYLERAMKLGLLELQVVNPARPLVFRDKLRLYMSMTLTPDYIIAPSTDALRISSATDRTSESSEAVSEPQPIRTRRIPIMAARNNNHYAPQVHVGNGASQNGTDNGAGQQAGTNVMQLLQEVEQIRGVLQEALGRVTHLQGALKHFRRHGKAMEDAMKSLRGLNFTG